MGEAGEIQSGWRERRKKGVHEGLQAAKDGRGTSSERLNMWVEDMEARIKQGRRNDEKGKNIYVSRLFSSRGDCMFPNCADH